MEDRTGISASLLCANFSLSLFSFTGSSLLLNEMFEAYRVGRHDPDAMSSNPQMLGQQIAASLFTLVEWGRHSARMVQITLFFLHYLY